MFYTSTFHLKTPTFSSDYTLIRNKGRSQYYQSGKHTLNDNQSMTTWKHEKKQRTKIDGKRDKINFALLFYVEHRQTPALISIIRSIEDTYTHTITICRLYLIKSRVRESREWKFDEERQSKDKRVEKTSLLPDRLWLFKNRDDFRKWWRAGEKKKAVESKEKSCVSAIINHTIYYFTTQCCPFAFYRRSFIEIVAKGVRKKGANWVRGIGETNKCQLRAHRPVFLLSRSKLDDNFWQFQIVDCSCF